MNLTKSIFTFLAVIFLFNFISSGADARPGSYYDWGRARNGYGYCYQYTPENIVLNLGELQNNSYCELSAPSHFDWGLGPDRYTHCYQYTSTGLPMNLGEPLPNNYCQ